MKAIEDPRNVIELDLEREGDLARIAGLCEALGNETRLNILRYLQTPPYIFTIKQLVKALGIPTTTLLFHLEKMQKADLVSIRYKSSTHGAQRFVGRMLHGADLRFYRANDEKKLPNYSVQSLGVGMFSEFTGRDFNFCTAESHFRSMSDNCYLPERFDAQLLYTSYGQIAYRFSNQDAKLHPVRELSLTLELCSEAPYFDNNYLSDITFWINGVEAATYVSPGDFGDRRGHLNPEWWPSSNTQYGILLAMAVNDGGVFFNGIKAQSKVSLADLKLESGNMIEVRFGNKATALNPGGFNLFGRTFGDYAQDILLTLTYEEPRSE